MTPTIAAAQIAVLMRSMTTASLVLRALTEQRADVCLLSAHLQHGEHPVLVNGEHHASGYKRRRRPCRDVSGEQDGHAEPGDLDSEGVVRVR